MLGAASAGAVADAFADALADDNGAEPLPEQGADKGADAVPIAPNPEAHTGAHYESSDAQSQSVAHELTAHAVAVAGAHGSDTTTHGSPFTGTDGRTVGGSNRGAVGSAADEGANDKGANDGFSNRD